MDSSEGDRLLLGKRSSFSNFSSFKTNDSQPGYDSTSFSNIPQQQLHQHSRQLQVPQQHQPQQQTHKQQNLDTNDGMHFGSYGGGSSYGPPQVYTPNSQGSTPVATNYRYGNEPHSLNSSRSQQYYNEKPAAPNKNAYYEAYWPLYSADWSFNNPPGMDLLALSTYSEDSSNQIQIIAGYPTNQNGFPSLEFQKSAEYKVPYPCTRIAWAPPSLSAPSNNLQLITTGDCLRLWTYNADNSQLYQRCALVNKTKSTYMPPVTSFDWNKIDPSIVITSSIDTTCTVWDVSTSTARTQLIAHDSEVFDVSFVAGSLQVFASVGADGSVRVFDLRSLDHSTVIYEPQQPVPLVRVTGNPQEENSLAALAANKNDIYILDIRAPGVPVATLTGHQAPVNSIAWSPSSAHFRPTGGSSRSSRHILASGADDCQALIWDVSETSRNPRPPSHPSSAPSSQSLASAGDVPIISAYTDSLEINSVTWSRDASWLGVVSGRGFQAVRL